MRFLRLLVLLFSLPFLFSFTKPELTSGSKHCKTIQFCSLEEALSLDGQTIGTSAVEVSWPQVPGVQNYLVVVTENGAPVHQSWANGTSKMVNGLVLGHTYHCTVVGMINGNQATDFIIAMDINP